MADTDFSEDLAQKAILDMAPGAKITSEYRTPVHNTEVGGVSDSMHTRLGGEAIDFVPPKGMTKAHFEAELAKRGLPSTELLDEGTHIHWGWGKKGAKMASGTATSPQGSASGAIPDTPEHADAMKRVGEAEKTTASSDVEYKASLDRYNKELAEIQAQQDKLLAGVPKPPTLDKLPEAPKEVQSQPTQVLGQFLPLLAILGGARAKSSSIGAMQAAAAAMNARRKNDTDAFERSHEEWKDKMQEAHEKWAEERDQYLDVMNNTKMAMDEKIAELHTLALSHGNEQMKNSVDHGNLQEAYKQLQLADTADYRLHQVATEAQRLDLDRTKTGLQAKRDAETVRWHEQQAPNQRFKQAKQLRDEVEKEVGKTYDSVTQFMPTIEKAEREIQNKHWGQSNALGSQEQAALLDAYTKIITGGQAIRGFTLKLNQEHAGLADKASILMSQLKQGGPLSERMEKEMVQVAKDYYAALGDHYSKSLDHAESFAKGFGMDRSDVTPFAVDPDALPGGGESAPSGSRPQIPQAAVAELSANPTPEMKQHFDEAFGAGAADAALATRH